MVIHLSAWKGNSRKFAPPFWTSWNAAKRGVERAARGGVLGARVRPPTQRPLPKESAPWLEKCRRLSLTEKGPGPARLRPRQALTPCCLYSPLHRLQDLIGAVEGVFARVPYLIDHLLWGIVALEVREHLVLSGGEVHVGQELLELAEVEVAKIA